MLSRWRVTESRISTLSGFDRATAMNLLHGDHAAVTTEACDSEAETMGSHETGSPCTALIMGRVYDLYNLRTIEVRGDIGSAE